MFQGSDLQSVSESELCAAELPPYLEVMQELHKLKQDLSRLKLATAFVIKSKVKAEPELEASSSKIQHCFHAAQQLREEIMDANEEHVLVELSRVEAEREIQQVTAQRQKEADKFAKTIRAAKGKIKSLRREIDCSKELESKLKITNSDLSVLQNEMEFVRAMDKDYQNYLLKETNSKKVDDTDDQSLLEAAEYELIAANKELVSLKEEGFQLMTSMDSTRCELIQIAEKNTHLKTLEGKSESRIQNLNSRLMKFKSKLDHALVAEERMELIISNLESALQQLQLETEAANKEEQQVFEETENVVSETAIIDSQTSFTESRLSDAARELEMAKKSEDLALRKLKKAIERTMDVRTCLTSSCNGSITISPREFEYLRHQATAAKAFAKKKVTAVQAWIEALDAGQKEMTMKSNLMEKRNRELRAMEVNLIDEIEKKLEAMNLVEENSHSKPHDIQENHVKRARKSSGIIVRPRKTKLRRTSASSKARRSLSSTSSITVKKRKKLFPTLVNFLSYRRNEEH